MDREIYIPRWFLGFSAGDEFVSLGFGFRHLRSLPLVGIVAFLLLSRAPLVLGHMVFSIPLDIDSLRPVPRLLVTSSLDIFAVSIHTAPVLEVSPPVRNYLAFAPCYLRGAYQLRLPDCFVEFRLTHGGVDMV